MNTFKNMIIAMVMIAVMASNTYAANWVLFFSSAAELNYYYDTDSIVKTNQGTTLVWTKSIPQKNAKFKPWRENISLSEVDCNRRIYKMLARRITNNDYTMKNEVGCWDWVYYEPYDLDYAYLKITCN